MVDKMHVKAEFIARIETLPTNRLKAIELRLVDWLADIRKFYPWPALEQSVSKDIETVWQEQERRLSRERTKNLTSKIAAMDKDILNSTEN